MVYSLPSLVSRSVEMLKCTDSIDGITYLEVNTFLLPWGTFCLGNICRHCHHCICHWSSCFGATNIAFSRTFINCRKTKVWYFIRWLFSYVLVVGNSCSVEKSTIILINVHARFRSSSLLCAVGGFMSLCNMPY